MSDLPPEPPSNPQLDPGIISRAPILPDPQDFNAEESDAYLQLVGELAAQNEELISEIARLKGKKTVEDVRASLMEPYANKVFWFLACYCATVAVVLLLTGFKWKGFALSDAVLGIISGSTAVSAIGLVGFVVSGLFGAKAKTEAS